MRPQARQSKSRCRTALAPARRSISARSGLCPSTPLRRKTNCAVSRSMLRVSERPPRPPCPRSIHRPTCGAAPTTSARWWVVWCGEPWTLPHAALTGSLWRPATSMPEQKVTIRVKVNGKEYERAVAPRLLLVEFLREELDLTGTHIGCDTSFCGACTVLLDGATVKSCTMFAVMADGG